MFRYFINDKATDEEIAEKFGMPDAEFFMLSSLRPYVEAVENSILESDTLS